MIHREEVEHIAKLARLGLTEVEIKNFQKELSSILDYFNLLKEIDLKRPFLSQKKKGLPSQTPLFLWKGLGWEGLVENVTREDLGKKQVLKTVNKLFEAAPKKEKGHIKVRAVLQ